MVKTFKIWRRVVIFCLIIISNSTTYSQIPKSITPPLPVELMLGNDRISFQMVVKKQFKPDSKFGFFGLATYNASYTNDQSDNDLVIPIQISYSFWKGFGIMTGATMNSKSGFSPIVGPQYNFANKKILAITVLSFNPNADKNIQLFGLYEFKPPLNDKWSIYSKLQFVYNYSINEDSHQRSYLQLRAGMRFNTLAFGLGTNLDQYGPYRIKKENYGIFLKWEFLN